MKKIVRSYVEAMRDELSLYGVTVDVENGGKHQIAVLTTEDGQVMRKPISGTSRVDEKALCNLARQDARRYLRAWGLRA